MQFLRCTAPAFDIEKSSIDTTALAINHFKPFDDFGFSLYDGVALSDVITWPTSKVIKRYDLAKDTGTNIIRIKWKNNDNNYFPFYLYSQFPNSSPPPDKNKQFSRYIYGGIRFNYSLNEITPNTFNSNKGSMPSLGINLASVSGSGKDYSNTSLIFLPLKNGGFLINTMCCENTDSSKTKILTKNLSLTTDQCRKYCSLYGVNMDPSHIFIGLPANYYKDNNNYFYIYNTNDMGRTNDENIHKYLITLDDGRGNKQQTTSDKTSVFSQYIDTDNKYTDIQSNLCIMYRYPWGDDFLDGLYIMATKPYAMEPGTFFTFGGRSFLNLYGSLCIELDNT